MSDQDWCVWLPIDPVGFTDPTGLERNDALYAMLAIAGEYGHDALMNPANQESIAETGHMAFLPNQERSTSDIAVYDDFVDDSGRNYGQEFIANNQLNSTPKSSGSDFISINGSYGYGTFGVTIGAEGLAAVSIGVNAELGKQFNLSVSATKSPPNTSINFKATAAGSFLTTSNSVGESHDVSTGFGNHIFSPSYGLTTRIIPSVGLSLVFTLAF